MKNRIALLLLLACVSAYGTDTRLTNLPSASITSTSLFLISQNGFGSKAVTYPMLLTNIANAITNPQIWAQSYTSNALFLAPTNTATTSGDTLVAAVFPNSQGFTKWGFPSFATTAGTAQTGDSASDFFGSGLIGPHILAPTNGYTDGMTLQIQTGTNKWVVPAGGGDVLTSQLNAASNTLWTAKITTNDSRAIVLTGNNYLVATSIVARIVHASTNYTDRVEATNSSSLVLYGGGAELQLTSGGVYTPSSGGFSGKGDLLTFDNEAYDASGWDNDLTAPTKNAVRDKMEALSVGATDPRFASSAGTITSRSNTFVASSFFGELTGNATTATTATTANNVADADKGDISISSGVWSIDNDVVTYAKIQNVTDNRLLGRSAGSSGDAQEITVGTGLTLSGGTLSATGGGGGGNASFPLTNTTVVLTNNGDFGVNAGISFEREWNSGSTSNVAINLTFNSLISSIYMNNVGDLTFDTFGNVHQFNQSVAVAGGVSATTLVGTGNRLVYADETGNLQPGAETATYTQTNDSRNITLSGIINATGSNYLSGPRRVAGAVMTTFTTNLTGSGFTVDWTKPGGYLRTSNSFSIAASGTPYEGSQYTLIVTNCMSTNVWGTNDFNSFDGASRQTGGVFLCPALSEIKVLYLYMGGLYRFYSEYGPNSVPLSMVDTNNGSTLTNLTGPKLIWPTNALADNALLDMTIPYGHTNHTAAFTITGFVSGSVVATNDAFATRCWTNNSVGEKAITLPSNWIDLGLKGNPVYNTNIGVLSVWVIPNFATNYLWVGK